MYLHWHVSVCSLAPGCDHILRLIRSKKTNKTSSFKPKKSLIIFNILNTNYCTEKMSSRLYIYIYYINVSLILLIIYKKSTKTTSLKEVHILMLCEICHSKMSCEMLCAMLSQYSVFNRGQEVQTELPLMVSFFGKSPKWHDEVSTPLTERLR